LRSRGYVDGKVHAEFERIDMTTHCYKHIFPSDNPSRISPQSTPRHVENHPTPFPTSNVIDHNKHISLHDGWRRRGDEGGREGLMETCKKMKRDFCHRWPARVGCRTSPVLRDSRTAASLRSNRVAFKGSKELSALRYPSTQHLYHSILFSMAITPEPSDKHDTAAPPSYAAAVAGTGPSSQRTSQQPQPARTYSLPGDEQSHLTASQQQRSNPSYNGSNGNAEAQWVPPANEREVKSRARKRFLIAFLWAFGIWTLLGYDTSLPCCPVSWSDLLPSAQYVHWWNGRRCA
jgi:hypothetical protein